MTMTLQNKESEKSEVLINKTKPKYAQVNQSEIYLYEPVSPVSDAVRVAMVYPAAYQIAMSSLGYLTLFQLLDENPNIDASRIYADTWDKYRSTSQGAGAEMMGYSFSFELDIIKIFESFEAFGIPQYAQDRDRHHPLIFAGGPVPMSNAEPFADFFDFFLIGEGEEIITDLATAYAKYRHLGSREELIRRLAAEVPGLYAPSMYHVEYASCGKADFGPISAITPKYDDVPAVVQKRFIENMDGFVASTPIITDKTIFSNMLLVEVMRGCAHRCRFCLASYSMLPARGAQMQLIMEKIEQGIQHTDKVGLLGALISNHPEFPELCDFLNHKEGLTISASSLRADTMTPEIARTFKKGKQKQLTIAVETGSDRLKRRINKNLTNEEVVRAASYIAEAGLEGLKIYGIVGLPDETEEDVVALAELLKDIKKANPKLKLHLGCSSFVPKAGTPFQWQPKVENKTVETRHEILRKSLLKVADVRASSAKWDYFQAFLSRGDRRLSKLLVRFYQLGGSLGAVNRAFKELKSEGAIDFPELDWYACRERPESEILPWDMINLGVAKNILYKEGQPPPGFH